jgi:hypothetical protein
VFAADIAIASRPPSAAARIAASFGMDRRAVPEQ